MKARTVLIADSDETAVATLKNHLKQLPFFVDPVVCPTLATVVAACCYQDFDVVFVDPNLPDAQGIDVLKALPTKSAVVVTTTSHELAVDCFDMEIADYVTKPYSYMRIVRAIGRALSIHLDDKGLFDKDVLYIKVGRSMQRFQYTEIDYIEALGSYSKLFVAQKSVVVNETISALEARLSPQRFLRIHKSYIINLSSLTMYNHSLLTVGGTKLPLGGSYRDTFDSFLGLISK